MCLAVGLPRQAIALVALLALGFAVDLVSLTSTGEHLVREKREDETGCSVGEVMTDFSDDQRLTDDGGTYLIQPQQMCNGCLTYLETCFFYNHTNSQDTPIFYSMQLGVFRISPTHQEYQLQGTLQTILSAQYHDEGRGCLCHSLIPEPLEDRDMIGVLFGNDCNSDAVCPLQPASTSMDVCSVLYYNQTASLIPLDGLSARNHCLNVMIQVTANCTVEPSPVPKCLLIPGPRQPRLTNSEIIGISFGGAGFLLTIAVLLSVMCYKIQKRHGDDYNTPSTQRERHSKRSHYRSIENRTFGEESGEANESISRVRRSKKHRRAAKAFATPPSDDSYRHSFRNRGYSDSNAYSLVGPIESDANSLVESGGCARQKDDATEDDTSEHHTAEPISIAASIAESASGHYESIDTCEHPFWIPANQAEELRAQFKVLKLPEISQEELQINEGLGSGQFGNVRKGVWQSPTGETEVAVKCLAEGSTEKERIKFLQEAAIMGQFKHPNILTIFGIVTTFEPLMILSEVMIKGDLHHYLHSLKPVTSSGNTAHEELKATFLSFCRQVAAGMGYLSHKSFIHRDLAARNILVSDADVCKIADFGLSRDLQDEEYYISSGGKVPVKWTAPEALTFRTYSTASDVWSYGVLLYEIWALGTKPYHDSTNKETLRMILSGNRLPPPPGCPHSIYELMLQCWHPEAQSRPTFFEILLALQRPDFQLLKWTSEDEAAYSEEARTVGSPVEAGQELYTELQQMYSYLDGGF